MHTTLITWIFVGYGLVLQVALVGFFAARRWAPAQAGALGQVSYALGGVGIPVAIWLAVLGAEATLWTGPLLWSLWAAFGAWADLWRHLEWRSPPVPGVLIPYVALYFFAQMFMWWPLWHDAFAAWVCYGLLFTVNTVLNLTGHSVDTETPGTKVHPGQNPSNR